MSSQFPHWSDKCSLNHNVLRELNKGFCSVCGARDPEYVREPRPQKIPTPVIEIDDSPTHPGFTSPDTSETVTPFTDRIGQAARQRAIQHQQEFSTQNIISMQPQSSKTAMTNRSSLNSQNSHRTRDTNQLTERFHVKIIFLTGTRTQIKDESGFIVDEESTGWRQRGNLIRFSILRTLILLRMVRTYSFKSSLTKNRRLECIYTTKTTIGTTTSILLDGRAPYNTILRYILVREIWSTNGI